MEKYKTVIIVNAIVFAVLGLLMGTSGMAFVGAIGVLQGCINVVIALIAAVPGGGKKHLVQAYLICGGTLLLIGFSLCSTYSLHLN